MLPSSYFLFLTFLILSFSLDNGMGRTPAMGWNSWNHFHCNINQELIKETADQLIKLGLAAKGYKFVNLDDCWQISRNAATKQIIPDSSKFPSGMKSLSDYIHSKGLYFGLYSDAGNMTCQKRPGSLNYQTIDANTYAKWEVDYLKYDNCFNQNISAKFRYPLMREALNKTGRPIYFSMCEWGQQEVAEWAGPVGNSWRTTGDIEPSWLSFLLILDKQAPLYVYAGPGGWNDPDMLEVGNGIMSHDEYQSHFSMWATLKAPLLIGCSLQNITNSTLEILGNEEVIAVNQDALGKQAQRIVQAKVEGVQGASQFDVWGGELSGERIVLAFLNRGNTPQVYQFSLDNPVFKNRTIVKIRDIVEKKDVGVPSEKYFQTKQIRKHAIGHYVFIFAPSQIQKEEKFAIRAEK